MIDRRDRLVLRPQLSGFRAPVLCFIVVLLLTQSCGGQSHVISTSQPIVAMVGDDIILPCHLEPTVDALDLTVEWARLDLDPRFVYLRRDHVELLQEEHPSYMGRTSLSVDRLKCGDVSLKLSKVKLSDAGRYRCLVPASGTESTVELSVGSVSYPEVEFSKVSDDVLLECKSKGWYPEPEMLWLDGGGSRLPAGPAQTARGPDDLYTVCSRVTVEQRHGHRFTCRVHQKDINQTRDTHLTVPAGLFVVQMSSAVRITIFSAVCLLSVAAVVFVVYKNKIRRRKSSMELLPLQNAEKQRSEREKMSRLNIKEAKLDEDFQRNEGELNHAVQLTETLTKQLKKLKQQRDKLISLQKEDKRKTEESNQELLKKEPIKKEIKIKLIEQINKDLEGRNKDYQTLIENTEEQLKTTESLIITLTERKGGLVREEEQIKTLLEKTQQERKFIFKSEEM